MDTDQLGVTENISCKSIKKVDSSPVSMETKDIIDLSSSPPLMLDDNGGFKLSPITPDSNKESVELMIPTFTSPLMLASPPPIKCDDSYMNADVDDDDNPSTPKEGVFDPFAPGPDKLMLAPVSMKYLEESRTYVARRLNFASLMTKKDCEKQERMYEDDDVLLEAVYDSLLEAIISKQAEDMLAEISADDVVKTPPCAPRLTGIADTCPGAPLKPIKKSRNMDLSMCRKLEF